MKAGNGSKRANQYARKQGGVAEPEPPVGLARGRWAARDSKDCECISMRILAIEREVPGVIDEAFRPHLKGEAARVWELYQAGVFRELYFRQDRPSAILVLECADAKEAEEVLNTLPLVKEELIVFDIIPLIPYPGFSRLFAEE